VLSVVGGLYAGYQRDLSPGPAIVLIALALFVVAVAGRWLIRALGVRPGPWAFGRRRSAAGRGARSLRRESTPSASASTSTRSDAEVTSR